MTYDFKKNILVFKDVPEAKNLSGNNEDQLRFLAVDLKGNVVGILKEDVGNGGTIGKAFIPKPYSVVMSIPYDAENPNIEIPITGALNLTITGTVNGDTGLVNLYFSSQEEATLNGVTNLIVKGTGKMIPVFFIHDSDGLKWYEYPSSSGGGSQDLQSVLRTGSYADIPGEFSFVDILGGSTHDRKVEVSINNADFTQGCTFKIQNDSLFLSNSGDNSNAVFTAYLGKVNIKQYEKNNANKMIDLQFESPIGNSKLRVPAKPTGTYTLATIDDTTVIYHKVVLTASGTISNVGNICISSPEVPIAFPIGSKITKTNGEIGIVATMNGGTGEFTTELPFPTDSTGINFICQSRAFDITSDGSIRMYDKRGSNAITLASNGQVRILGTTFNGNGDVNASVLSLSSTTTYANDAAADADINLPAGSIYFITADRTARKKP